MTHYQKIAAMILRLIATSVLLVILPLLILSLALVLPSTKPFWILIILLPYLIAVITLFATSRSLAKMICHDFDK